MKSILIITPYSNPSACGIWMRAIRDGELLKTEGYNVNFFSSNIIKGTNKKSSKEEIFDGFNIKRFKVWFSFGGTSMFWFYLPQLLKVNPDIIHTHGYRHPHSLQALIFGKLLGKKVILTTHGPFKKDPNRSIHLKIFDFLYDFFIGWWELKLYNKVIRIAEWEKPYLKKLGVSNSEIVPNSIDDDYISSTKISTQVNSKILYMGRVDPVKRIETIFAIAKRLPNIKFKIYGPIHGYKNLKPDSVNVEVISKTYTKEDFINELKDTDIYLLPSIRESFSLSTIEAMASGVIPVVSNSALGPKDFIIESKNGFFFKDLNDLENKIKKIYKNWSKMMSVKDNARNKAKEYTNSIVGNKLIQVYNELRAKS